MEIFTVLLLSAPFALLILLAYSFSHAMTKQVDELLLGLRGQVGKVSHRLEKMEAKVDVMERALRTQKKLGKKRLPRLMPPPGPALKGAHPEVLDYEDTLPKLRNAVVA